MHRKSYEFEDLLQSSSENSRVDWYAQTKLGLTRTLSEENVYEDILGKRPNRLRRTVSVSLTEAERRLKWSFCLKHIRMHLNTDVQSVYEKAAGRQAGRVGLCGLKERGTAGRKQLRVTLI